MKLRKIIALILFMNLTAPLFGAHASSKDILKCLNTPEEIAPYKDFIPPTLRQKKPTEPVNDFGPIITLSLEEKQSLETLLVFFDKFFDKIKKRSRVQILSIFKMILAALYMEQQLLYDVNTDLCLSPEILDARILFIASNEFITQDPSINDFAVFYQACTVVNECKELIDTTPALELWHSAAIRIQLERLRTIAQAGGVSPLLHKFCYDCIEFLLVYLRKSADSNILSRSEDILPHNFVKFGAYCKTIIRENRYLDSKLLSIMVKVFRKGIAKANFPQTCPDLFKPVEKRYWSTNNSTRQLHYVVDPWMAEYYREIHQKLRENSLPGFLQFTMDGKKYNYPDTMTGQAVLVEKHKEKKKKKTIVSDPRSIDEVFAALGIEVEHPASQKNKKKKKKKKRKKRKKTLAVTPPADVEVVAAADCAAPQVLAVVQEHVPPIRVNYTRSAKSWFRRPQAMLKRDGYLILDPTTAAQAIRRRVFQEQLVIHKDDREAACEAIIENHTLPRKMDEFVIRRYGGESHADQGIVVPVCKISLTDGSKRYGLYHLCYQKTSDSTFLVYHRVFKTVAKEKFAGYLKDQKAGTLIDDIDRELEAADDDGGAWQPAHEDHSIIDDTSTLYTSFTGTNVQYVLLKGQ